MKKLFLFIAMSALIQVGAWGQTSGTFGDSGTSIWSYDNGTMTITLNATGDLTESSWGFGYSYPWSNDIKTGTTKVVFKFGDSVTSVNSNILYLFSETMTNVKTFDFSNLTADQVGYFVSAEQNFKSAVTNVVKNVILPAGVSINDIDNNFNVSGSTVTLNQTKNISNVDWSAVDGCGTTLKFANDVTSAIDLSSLTSYTTIDLSEVSVSAMVKVNESVVTSVTVSNDTSKDYIYNSDGTTLYNRDNVTVPFSGVASVTGGNVRAAVTALLAANGASASDMKKITITSGTLTQDDLDYIATLTNLVTLDMSAAEADSGTTYDYSGLPTSLTSLSFPHGTNAFPNLSSLTSLKYATAVDSSNNPMVYVYSSSAGSLDVSGIPDTYNTSTAKVYVGGTVNTTDLDALGRKLTNSRYFDFDQATGVTVNDMAQYLGDWSGDKLVLVLPNGTSQVQPTAYETKVGLVYAKNGTTLNTYVTTDGTSRFPNYGAVSTGMSTLKLYGAFSSHEIYEGLSNYPDITCLDMYDCTSMSTSYSYLSGSNVTSMILKEGNVVDSDGSDYSGTKLELVTSSNAGVNYAWSKTAGTLGSAYGSVNTVYDYANADKSIFYGNYNGSDLTAINNVCSTSIDLSNATWVSGSVYNISNGCMEYLRLPNGMNTESDVTSMKGLRAPLRNANLKVVGATNGSGSSASQLAMYSFVSTNVDGYMTALMSDERDNIKSIRMAGNYGLGDLDRSTVYPGGTNNLIFGGQPTSFDFTGATFDPYTITSMTVGPYSDATHPYARVQDATSDNPALNTANDPFADRSSVGTMTLENYETNTFCFIQGYGTNLTSIILPTGNTDIPPQTFKNSPGLTSIDIPANYVTIGHEAFAFTGLTTVTIGNGVKTIEAGAFATSKLEEVKFQSGLSDQVYGPAVFSQCTNMKHIVLPEGITTLGADMFNNSQNVESIRLPQSLLYIGSGCFKDAHSLSSITIPQNVKKIGQETFALTAIKDVYLTCTDPDKLPEIWTMGDMYNQGDIKSTFGTNTLNNNITNNKSGADKLSSMTWDEAVLDFYAARGVAVLHFPEELKDAVKASISETYRYKSTDGYGLPDLNPEDYTSTTNDFNDRCLADGLDVGTHKDDGGIGIYSVNGWAQFLLMKAYKPDDEDIVYHQYYDDVWYTMCFPFDLTDEQLAVAFAEDFNICEFDGAKLELVSSDDATKTVDYTLTFHFNTVAKAQYKDQNGNVYEDLGKSGDYHTYKRDGVTYEHVSLGGGSTAKTKTYAASGTTTPVYFIDGYLSQAGHPYMVHPNTGALQGSPKVRCDFSGIKWYEGDRDALYESEAVSSDVNVSGSVGGESYNYSGTYVFKGKWSDTTEKIPERAYFLGRKKDAGGNYIEYPKYYHNLAGASAGNWTQYSAVILSDQASTIEALITHDSAAKAYNFVIDEDWEQQALDPTAIQRIVDDARQNGQVVKHLNVVVNINGQVVRSDSTSLEGLPKGIYIVNGKKYYVK